MVDIGHVGKIWWWLRAPGEARGTTTRAGAAGLGSGHGDLMVGGEKLVAMVGEAARAWKRRECARGKEQELTEMRQGRSAASGTLWTRRIDGVDLRAPEVKTTTLRSTGASSGRVRRVCCSTGSWRSSGTRRGSEGVAAATANGVGALRLVRSAMGERAEGRDEVAGEGERGQGSLASPWRREDRAKGEQEVEAGGGARLRAR